MRELRDAVRTMIRRASIAAVDDGGTQQTVDLLGFAGDSPRQVVRVQEFGIADNPPVGGEGLILCAGGRSDKALFIGGAGKGRPTNTPSGWKGLYDAGGNVVFCQGPNGIVVKASEGKIVVIPPPGANVYLGGDGVTGTYFPVLLAGNRNAMNVFGRFA
jgi:phage baseplate assembly protein V